MKNLERYQKVFMETFEVDESVTAQNPTILTLDGWDSVAQMNFIAHLEEEFDIMMDPEDIVELNSYEKGKEILGKYGVLMG